MLANTTSDRMLVSRCQSGDRHAFDVLIRTHQAQAYKFAFGLTHDGDEAADVVAEGFVRVFRAIDKFKGDSSFTTWLYRILTNCFLDMRKKASRRATTSLDAPQGELEIAGMQLADRGQSPYDVSESKARARRLVGASNLIPKSQKAILHLFHGEMLTYLEISERLNMPVGTVKSRLNRARISLRTRLASDQELFHMGHGV